MSDIDYDQLAYPIQSLKSGGGTRKKWTKLKEFDSKTGALEFIDKEASWAIMWSYETKEGLKVQYRCNQVEIGGEQCPAGIQLLYYTDRETVGLYRTERDHDHDNKCKGRSRGLSKSVRSAIEELCDQGVDKPKAIFEILNRQLTQPPSMQQVKDYVRTCKRRTKRPSMQQSNTGIVPSLEGHPETEIITATPGIEMISTTPPPFGKYTAIRDESDDNYDQDGNTSSGEMQQGQFQRPITRAVHSTPHGQVCVSSAGPSSNQARFRSKMMGQAEGIGPAKRQRLWNGNEQDSMKDASMEILKTSVLLLEKQAWEKDLQLKLKKEAAIDEFRRYIAEQRLLARGMDISHIPVDIPPGLEAFVQL